MLEPHAGKLARAVLRGGKLERVYLSQFHVIIGTIFLIICGIRQYLGHFTPKHHFGFEAAAFYWHFVDVVWLFLLVSIYWWGGN